jgi:GntR family transcriptional regulator/MocR family aminotransferase
MLLLNLDRNKAVPLFKQIFYQLKKMIDSGVIREGDRLPSSRLLAADHGINRTTVYKAYEELWSLGYIASKSGSYSYVRRPKILFADKGKISEKSIINWRDVTDERLHLLSDRVQVYKRTVPDNCINFRVIAPDKRLMPVTEFRKCMNEVLIEKGEELMDYGSPQGYLPLREYLAQHMQKHGITTSPEEIMITNGAQDGLNMLLQLFNKGTVSVVVEEPTYEWALRLFQAKGVEIIPIPLRDNGLDLIALKAVLKKRKVSFIYTIPNFQNPTGISTGQAHREELLQTAEQYNVPVIEDGFEEEMKYFTRAVLPIKSMDSSNLVLYLGTFSKVLFPGLRIGWIVANKSCIKYLNGLKNISDFAVSTLNQAALERFCRKGLFDKHLKRLHTEYKNRMQTFYKAAGQYLKSDELHITRPIGGYTIWLAVKNPVWREDKIAEDLEKAGV